MSTPQSISFTPAASPAVASRGRAIGKAAFYLALAFVTALLVSAALRAATGRTLAALMRSGPADALLAHVGLLVALVIIPTSISLRLSKEPIAYSGWSRVGGGRLVAAGLTGGAGLMALIVATLWAAGAWSGAVRPMSAAHGVGTVVLSALLWLVQAAHEEGLYRGYAFVQLSRAVTFWPAAVILSLGFLWSHVGHDGATPMSLAVAGLFAMVLAYSLLRTGSLWFALGFHASWNFTQSFVFGLPNSGGSPPAALIVSHVQGSPLLTGGSAGPEGSLLTVLAIAALATFIHFRFPAARPVAGRSGEHFPVGTQ